jgi:hypothetical protein
MKEIPGQIYSKQVVCHCGGVGCRACAFRGVRWVDYRVPIPTLREAAAQGRAAVEIAQGETNAR